MEGLEEEFTGARCYLMGTRKVLVAREGMRQGRGLGKPSGSPGHHAGESRRGLREVDGDASTRAGFMGRRLEHEPLGLWLREDGIGD